MNIHFVGCEGVSMKVLSRIVESYGHTVTGSDLNLNGHDPKYIENADTVIYTSAVGENNCEVMAARKKGLRVYERAEFLGIISKNYTNVIAVSGSHGKTTATGFCEQIFLPFNPTVHIGGKTRGESGHLGGREYFITEACEYKRSFLHIKPNIGIILNIELDHTDYYKDEEDYFSAFQSFAEGSKVMLVNGDDALCRRIKTKNVYTFGLNNDNYFMASNIKKTERGHSFDVYIDKKFSFAAKINIHGTHNVYNALAAVAAAYFNNVDVSQIKLGLESFEGVKRRFEYIGINQNSLIYSDYAHHPTEIKTTVLSAREISKNRLTIVFEPHTYSRTKSLQEAFIHSLSLADRVIVGTIYPAREAPLEGVTSHNIVRGLLDMGKKAVYKDNFYSLAEYLYITREDDEIIVFTGAGEIEKAAKIFAEFNGNKH